MKIEYSYTILYVADVKQTIAFYNQAFEFEVKFITPENDYGELITGSTVLAFASIELGKSNFSKGFTQSTVSEKPFGFELAFTTKEVEKAVAKAIEHGATLLEEIVQKPWGQQVAYLRDSNGFIIEICSPMGNQ